MSVNPTSRFSLSDPQTSSIAQEAERKGSEPSRTPSPSILYHPSEGPTPGRQTSIKLIPSTIEREQRRVDALSQDLTGPEFDVYQDGILRTPGVVDTNSRIIARLSKKFPILPRILNNPREHSIYNTPRSQ